MIRVYSVSIIIQLYLYIYIYIYTFVRRIISLVSVSAFLHLSPYPSFVLSIFPKSPNGKVSIVRAPMMVTKTRERGSAGAEGKDRPTRSLARGGQRSKSGRGPIKQARRGIYRARARDESRVRSRRRGHLKRSFRESLLGEKSACARAAPMLEMSG